MNKTLGRINKFIKRLILTNAHKFVKYIKCHFYGTYNYTCTLTCVGCPSSVAAALAKATASLSMYWLSSVCQESRGTR